VAIENKASLNNVLQSVLSVSGQEMNAFYSPKIYSDQRNVVESLFLSALVKAYPLNQNVIDQISPFVEVETIPVTDGYIQLPDNYRNLLGSPMIFANPESTGECGQSEPLTQHNFRVGILKSGCRLNPVTILPQSEFADATQSTYKQPNYENPIGYFIDSNKLKICPFDVTKVTVMYARKEQLVRYGYYTNPDDTYGYDPLTTIETDFNSSAFEPIFKAMLSLYSAYSKDQEIQNWSVILNREGIL
jgi:hypothetical protein